MQNALIIIGTVFVIAVFAVIVCRAKSQKTIIEIILFYLVSVIILTIVLRNIETESHAILDLFQKYKEIARPIKNEIRKYGFVSGVCSGVSITQKTITEILLNILLFVPFGFLLPSALKSYKQWWNILLFGFLFSLVIEVLQFATHRGWFDVSDLMHNTFGSGIGYLVYRNCISVRREKH